MLNILLHDQAEMLGRMKPLTLTRPVSYLRFGIMTIAEKWKKAIPGATVSAETSEMLSELFPAVVDREHPDDNIIISSEICPDEALVEALLSLAPGESLFSGERFIASRGLGEVTDRKDYAAPVLSIEHIYDVFMKNGDALCRDFEVLTSGRKSAPLSDSCRLIGPADRLFIEEGATVEGAIINTTKGPVYVGRDAEIMEGACLRGPVALCEHAVVNMGGKIYGPTTLGPYCKVGGELNNVVMTGYSNKAHDGFLGNAVTGEWCNLGAGCTASNLKNTYGEIKLWSMEEGRFVNTGLQFCGLIMGDHSKAGINTMFNTATVVGVGVNFYGAGFPRTFIPSFTEGSTSGMRPTSLSRFFDTAERMMARRHVSLTEADRRLLTHIYETTHPSKD
ncbi:MAG: glucose-1-phosphate thymidylyltransferase [Duncaniella sp.]|nr:glucose-1-phosphate thymidylyltransferase [Duncaniella sp.]